MGKITRNYIYNLAYQILVLIVPLITAPYLARVLGPKGTGIYSYIYSMTTIICTFVMLGIYNYGSRQIAYVRDNEEKLSETFCQIMCARFMIGILGTIVYWIIILIIGKYISLFAIYYTYILAYFIDCTWLFVGVEDMKWAVIKNAATKIFSVIGIFSFVKDKNDIAIYIMIQGLSLLISNILAYTQLRLYINRFRVDFQNIKRDMKGSLLLFLPSIATTIYTQCDKVMIELMIGKTNQVSYYDYSEKIVMIPMTCITVISTVMMPRIANEFKKGNNSLISSYLNKCAKFSMFIACPMIFGLIACSDKLIPWYLGNDFSPTILAINLIAPIILANTLTGIAGGQFFTATNQIKILIKSQTIAVIGNIALNSILIPLLGFVGAAIATLTTSYLIAVIQMSYLIKQVKLPGLVKSSFKYLVISGLMFCVIRVFTANRNASPMVSLIQICIGLVFYFSICYIIKDEHIEIIKEKIHGVIKR